MLGVSVLLRQTAPSAYTFELERIWSNLGTNSSCDSCFSLCFCFCCCFCCWLRCWSCCWSWCWSWWCWCWVGDGMNWLWVEPAKHAKDARTNTWPGQGNICKCNGFWKCNDWWSFVWISFASCSTTSSSPSGHVTIHHFSFSCLNSPLKWPWDPYTADDDTDNDTSGDDKPWENDTCGADKPWCDKPSSFDSTLLFGSCSSTDDVSMFIDAVSVMDVLLFIGTMLLFIGTLSMDGSSPTWVLLTRWQILWKVEIAWRWSDLSLESHERLQLLLLQLLDPKKSPHCQTSAS